MIASFSDSIFNGKITIDEANKKQITVIYQTIIQKLMVDLKHNPRQTKRKRKIFMKVKLLIVKVEKQML